MIARALLGVAFITVTVAPAAWAEICAPGRPGLSIYYVNGILSDLGATLDSAVTLSRSAREFFGTFSSPENCLKQVGVSYNPAQGFIRDLYESYLQLRGAGSSEAEFVEWMLALAEPEGAFLAALLDEFERAQGQVIAGVRDDFVAEYRKNIAAGNKVVTVSHSQGNFYANGVHASLYGGSTPLPTRSFGIVGVATPASEVAGGGLHTTLEKDIILRVPGRLGENVRAGECVGSAGLVSLLSLTELHCHMFIDSYMGLDPPRQKILQDLLAVAGGLQLPTVRLPVAQNDQYTMNQGTTLTVVTPGVLGNDTIPSGVSPTVEFVNIPAGNFINRGAGAFDFTPNPSVSGSVTFGYVIHSSLGDSNIATVAVQVQPNTSPQIARNDAYSMTRGSTLTVSTPGVLANDSIPSGLTATVEFVTFPTGGITNSGGGGFTYTPPPSFTGTQVFSYVFHTPSGDSNVASVTIVVNP